MNALWLLMFKASRHRLCWQACGPAGTVSQAVGVDLKKDAESRTSPYEAQV